MDTKGDLLKERQLRTNVETIVNTIISRDNALVMTREERERLVKELVDEALGLTIDAVDDDDDEFPTTY